MVGGMWEGEGLFRVVHPRCETEGPHASAHTVFICFFFLLDVPKICAGHRDRDEIGRAED